VAKIATINLTICSCSLESLILAMFVDYLTILSKLSLKRFLLELIESILS
jgi:hypothetical protein